MKIEIWRCSQCGDPACIMLKVDAEPDAPGFCPFSASGCTWQPEKISIDALIEYFSEYGETE